jgi:hypothetical protein
MCTEWHHRFRRCGHTRFYRWEYCKRVKKKKEQPGKGRACPKYELKYRDNQKDFNCFVCIAQRTRRASTAEREANPQFERT